jgi:hypothetical protein
MAGKNFITMTELRHRWQLARNGEYNNCWLVLRNGLDIFSLQALPMDRSNDKIRVKTDTGWTVIDLGDIVKAVH